MTIEQSAGDYFITVNDFGGFDDDQDEMENEDYDGKVIDHLLEEIEKHCQSIEDNDFHEIYIFDGLRLKQLTLLMRFKCKGAYFFQKPLDKAVFEWYYVSIFKKGRKEKISNATYNDNIQNE